MRKLVVSEWMTLDGVFDADTMERWFTPYQTEARATHIKQVIAACDALLFGRTTYEMLAPYWSAQQNDENGPAAKLNSVSKYVVSSKMQKADWNNSTIISKDVVKEIARLKHQPGSDIVVLGSAVLVQSLKDTDLIDEYRLLVHPIVLGSGKRFFNQEKVPKKLVLLEAKTIEKGVIALHYATTK